MNRTEADRHRRIADGFTLRVEGVTDWDAPSPVEGWRAREVVEHLVTWFPGFLAAGGEELPAGPDAEDDPAAAWKHQADAIQRLLEAPDADRGFTHPHVGEMPLTVAVDRFYTSDVFMHTWDLARATGQDDHLDPDECATLLAGMEPMEQMLRDSGQYGSRVPVRDDASVQDRLIGFIGRDPAWQPSAT